MERIPILRIGEVLLASIQIELHDTLVEQLQLDILRTIEARPARGLVIDVSAVAVLDTFTARALAQTAEMAALMGTKTVVAGFAPAVALTLVEMGFATRTFGTAVDLQAALAMV